MTTFQDSLAEWKKNRAQFLMGLITEMDMLVDEMRREVARIERYVNPTPEEQQFLDQARRMLAAWPSDNTEDEK